MHAAQQFGDEGRGHRRLVPRHVGDHQHHILGPRFRHLGQAVGPDVGEIHLEAVASDVLTHPAQVFNQRQTQHDRNRPQLAEAERLDLLVGRHVAAKAVDVDPAIAVGNGIQRNVVHTWQASGRSAAQARELAAVSTRQMPSRDRDLLLDQVDIVEQPIACRGDPPLRMRRCGQQRAGLIQRALIVGQALQQPFGLTLLAVLMAASQTAPVFFQLFRTEQGRTQRIVVGHHANG